MKSKKVLIVDDEDGPRGILEEFTDFADLNLIVTTAATAKEAVIKSAQNQYNWGLVILYGLKGRCFQVADIIKEMNSETKIMLWSGNDDINGKLPHLHFDGTLNKPLVLREYTTFLNNLYNSNGSQDK